MTAHIVGVECPTADVRVSLTDEEFWTFVLQGVQPGDEPDEPDFDDDQTTNQNGPCPECGEHGACAYDAEGRALVHTTTNGDEE